MIEAGSPPVLQQGPAPQHSQRGEERALLHVHFLHRNDAGNQGAKY